MKIDSDLIRRLEDFGERDENIHELARVAKENDGEVTFPLIADAAEALQDFYFKDIDGAGELLDELQEIMDEYPDDEVYDEENDDDDDDEWDEEDDWDEED